VHHEDLKTITEAADKYVVVEPIANESVATEPTHHNEPQHYHHHCASSIVIMTTQIF
jgi:hypothetical protein